MRFESLFIIWAEGPGGLYVLPSGFFDGETAKFWAELFCGATGYSVIIDAVPYDGYVRHMAGVRFCALVSEESFFNAYGDLASYCLTHGGLAEGSRLAGKPYPDGDKLEE